MGRAPCCDKANVKKGPWSPEEDEKLKEYIDKHGIGGNWIALPQKAGLKRCGKSCRLRWLNYLRPNLKHGEFSEDEDTIICSLFASIGSRWSIIASQLPGRTDNDIKNYWNTKLKKKMMGIMNPSALKKPHEVTMLQSSTPSSSNSSSSTLSFKTNHNNSCYQPQVSFTESISYSSLLSGNSSTTCAYSSTFQAQESSFGFGPIQNCQVSSGFVLGGETSCSSSSDGSYNNNNNQMSHVKEAELGYGGDGSFGEHVIIGGLGYLSSGVEDLATQKLMMPSNAGRVSGWTGEESRLWGESALDYGLEEIKQLISTSSCNNFMFDDSKTGEMVMYY